uniref:Uncharacterized protein n=1 Tax=Rhizophora mucronata TaxID=61149 RepID=A0A2P2PII2_RHIMU
MTGCRCLPPEDRKEQQRQERSVTLFYTDLNYIHTSGAVQMWKQKQRSNLLTVSCTREQKEREHGSC